MIDILRIGFISAACTVMIFSFIALLTPVDVMAQQPTEMRHAMERAHIIVSQEGGQCLYDIQGQREDDQDTLRVRANGRVTLLGRGGVMVQAEVEDDRQRNVPGLRERPQIQLDRFQMVASRRARAPSGVALTEHRVRIQCCAREAGVRQCSEWQDAVSRADLRQMGQRVDPVEKPFMAGPFAFDFVGWRKSDIPILIPGGPVMQVAE